MTYKGYTARIQYCDEDAIFFGRLEHINDIISFEGNSVENLKKEFKLSVNDYIETCKQVGKAPDKPYKGVFNVRISPDLHKKAHNKALELNISLNKLVEQSIQKNIETTQ